MSDDKDFVPTSPQQLKALNLYCTQLAEALNEANHSVPYVLSQSKRFCADMPWTQLMVKELLWRKIQIAMTGVESTTEVGDKIDSIYDVVNKAMGQTFMVHVPFPSEETLSEAQR